MGAALFLRVRTDLRIPLGRFAVWHHDTAHTSYLGRGQELREKFVANVPSSIKYLRVTSRDVSERMTRETVASSRSSSSRENFMQKTLLRAHEKRDRAPRDEVLCRLKIKPAFRRHYHSCGEGEIRKKKKKKKDEEKQKRTSFRSRI